MKANTPPKEDKMKTLSYSRARAFMNCRQRYAWQYLHHIRPKDDAQPLNFGRAIHAALESFYKYRNESAAMDAIRDCKLGDQDETKALVLFAAYLQRYGSDALFDIIDVEKEFTAPIYNPDTNRPSRTWTLAGRVDAVIRRDDGIFIVEHKTATVIDAAYISRVTIDLQIATYAVALSRIYGEPIAGCIYNIIKKPMHQMRKGETDEEFERRRSELLAKSKTGKTSAKKREPETVDEFAQRLAGEIDDSYFVREIVRFDNQTIADGQRDLWSVARDIQKGIIYRNTSACNGIGRCPYLELCRNRGDLDACGDLYEIGDKR